MLVQDVHAGNQGRQPTVRFDRDVEPDPAANAGPAADGTLPAIRIYNANVIVSVRRRQALGATRLKEMIKTCGVIPAPIEPSPPVRKRPSPSCGSVSSAVQFAGTNSRVETGTAWPGTSQSISRHRCT